MIIKIIIIYAVIGIVYTSKKWERWSFYPDTIIDHIFCIGWYIMMVNYFPLFILLDIEEYYVLKKYDSFEEYRKDKI